MTVLEEGDLQITIGDAIIGTEGTSLAPPAGSELWRVQYRVVEQPLPAIPHSATKCGDDAPVTE